MYDQHNLPTCYSYKTFENNIKAILKHNRPLAHRLCYSVDGSHIFFDNNKKPYYQIQNSITPIPLEQNNTKNTNFKPTDNLFIFGIGTGDLTAKILAENSFNKIIIWDRDPWLLRLFLMKHDVSKTINGNNLKILLGVDIFNNIKIASEFKKIITQPFDNIYSNELKILNSKANKKTALICSGSLFVSDIADKLHRKGYNVYTLDYSRLSIEEINLIFDKCNPDFVFSINYIEGLSQLCEQKGIKLFCWEIDPATTDIKKSKQNDNTFIYTYRQKNVELFKNAGFKNTFYLPLATNTNKRIPSPKQNEYKCNVSFVGVSMLSQAKSLRDIFDKCCEQMQDPNVESKLIFDQILEIQKKDFGKFVIPELIKKFLPNLNQNHCTIRGYTYNPVMLIGEFAAAIKRMYYISALGKFNINVWGDNTWNSLNHLGIIYKGPAGHTHEINKIYSNSLINIDINRLYQNDIVSMRVFDVMACGGFVLAEHSDDIEQLFTIGKELDTFKSIEEMVSKTEYYLKNKNKVIEIANNGRLRVIKDHTIKKRLETILKRGYNV